MSSYTQGVANNYLAPPAPQSLDNDWFLPVSTMRFGSQDYHMRQLQKTLVCAKALQYWVEKAQLMPLDEHCQIAESVLELWQSMEPLTTFTNAEVLEDAPPSHWVKITSSQTLEPADPPTSWEHSHSRSHRAQAERCISSNLWHRVIKTHSHCPGGESISLPGPEDGVAARRHCQSMVNTPGICRDCEIPAWG